MSMNRIDCHFAKVDAKILKGDVWEYKVAVLWELREEGGLKAWEA